MRVPRGWQHVLKPNARVDLQENVQCSGYRHWGSFDATRGDKHLLGVTLPWIGIGPMGLAVR